MIDAIDLSQVVDEKVKQINAQRQIVLLSFA